MAAHGGHKAVQVDMQVHLNQGLSAQVITVLYAGDDEGLLWRYGYA